MPGTWPFLTLCFICLLLSFYETSFNFIRKVNLVFHTFEAHMLEHPSFRELLVVDWQLSTPRALRQQRWQPQGSSLRPGLFHLQHSPRQEKRDCLKIQIAVLSVCLPETDHQDQICSKGMLKKHWQPIMYRSLTNIKG